MKKQDREEAATQGSGDAPPAAETTESPAAAKDGSVSSSPQEPEPQTDAPPQGTEASGEGRLIRTILFILFITKHIVQHNCTVLFI